MARAQRYRRSRPAEEVTPSTLLRPFWLLRAAVAAVRLYEGLWCKLLRGQPYELSVVEAIRWGAALSIRFVLFPDPALE